MGEPHREDRVTSCVRIVTGDEGSAMWVAIAAAVMMALVAPGTEARPILSAAEAEPFTEANYLRWSGTYAAPARDPWHPRPITTPRADFVVGATHATVQQAVNAAFARGGTARRYIKILPGTYTGTVFIPAGTPPLTLYGAGRPEDVRLEYTLDATATPAEWAARVNPSGQYARTRHSRCVPTTTARSWSTCG
jgi:pectinesterase